MVTEENIIIQDFSEEMKNSYRDYSVSVIISRALPDVRDGLKPVQRRILYAMNELGLAPDKQHRKSARIVGDTMGKYHPHGDSSIYDALVHMAEEWSMSVPLVDGHGNFGSIDGDSAAAMRYTEARLSKGAMNLLTGLDRNLVDFVPNFDEREKEPVILPAKLPFLLINGTTGIAVGMATNIPPHNPGEIIKGAIALLDNPELSTEKLMKYIPGPDFPTGGIISNADEIAGIYENGEGRLRVRGKYVIEDGDNGKKNIVFTEIPFTSTGNKSRLVESLVNLMKDKVFDEIADVRDESSSDVRIVVEVKKGRNVDNLLNGIFKKTPLEDTYSVNMLAVRDKQPKIFSLKGILEEFLSFEEELYTKEYTHLLEKARARAEVVDGLIKAVDVIDLIIEVLRGSESIKQAKDCLVNGNIAEIKFKSEASKKEAKGFDFTEAQADAILAMPLSRLIGLEVLKLTSEAENLKNNIDEYNKILSDKSELHKVIKTYLKANVKNFDRPRRTELLNEEKQVYVEEVKEEDVYVLIDRFGYAKSVDVSGISKANEEALNEYPTKILMRNTDRLCIFTASGNMHQVKVKDIPKVRLRDKGTLVHNISKVGKEEIILYTSFAVLYESMVFFATKKGFVKLVSGVEFDTNRSVMLATKLEEGDELLSVRVLSAAEILSHDLRVYMLTKKKIGLSYLLDEVVEMKKSGRGVKGISLAADDEVKAVAVEVSATTEVEFDGDSYKTSKFKLKKRAAKGDKIK